jgi:ketosteroid isomerase-like protein
MMAIDDQREIEALLLRYATAADTRDRALLESCFTEDVRADYGRPIGRFDTRAALVAALEATLGACGATLHFVTNKELSEQGEAVAVRSYTHAVVYPPGAEAPRRTAGIYDDRFVRTPAGWRIAERHYTGIT